MHLKFILIATASLMMAACSTGSTVKTNLPVNMANPASVYCHQQGGKLSMIQSSEGTTGYCTLPGGELVEEWALYHRDHPKG